MENLRGKTAFITGGASGIGLGIAKACAAEGMNIVIADMRKAAIDEALEYFKSSNLPAIGVELNVTDREAYKSAADSAESAFGKIHVLVNNAGIGCSSGPLWSVSHKDADVAVAVNLIGVLNGVQEILPRIIAHGEGGHVVATASKSAIVTSAGTGLYNITKSGVVAMMETLATDLQGTPVGASVFAPGGYITNLGQSSAAVTAAMTGVAPPAPPPGMAGGIPDSWVGLVRDPLDAGRRVVRGIKRGDLYILTHAEFKAGWQSRADAITRAFPDETPNPRYSEVFPFLTGNPIYGKQEQVPALPTE
ncbi:MAG: SDR family NAD(P)-dependent oxidoreductase [Oscillospiraceae bacterium]|jgi:NAD(P)-dependent dehydrogenase (short-subunit alcohol dehydrogenase family)|nr:SDR family NAD(P)-dependent oxidoreductase [Oscillospiraceae bacterium]